MVNQGGRNKKKPHPSQDGGGLRIVALVERCIVMGWKVAGTCVLCSGESASIFEGGIATSICTLPLPHHGKVKSELKTMDMTE